MTVKELAEKLVELINAGNGNLPVLAVSYGDPMEIESIHVNGFDAQVIIGEAKTCS